MGEVVEHAISQSIHMPRRCNNPFGPRPHSDKLQGLRLTLGGARCEVNGKLNVSRLMYKSFVGNVQSFLRHCCQRRNPKSYVEVTNDTD